jgi:phosphoribosyl 1,2-cyclic phosphodiesterase
VWTQPTERAVSSEPRTVSGAEPDVSVHFWGTRGSIPSPGASTARFGGNTSCVEIRAANGPRLIFDAGSGIRALGHDMCASGAEQEGIVFLTHFHWDHIQGFPFFVPLYRPSTRISIVGPEQRIGDLSGLASVGAEQKAGDIRSLFAGQMGPVYFPIPYEALSAKLSFHHLNHGTFEGDGYRVSAMRVRHPSFTVGYRTEIAGRVVTYVPDNELDGDMYKEVDKDAGSWAEAFTEFVRGSDILIHDAMYTTEEYRHRHGWGHSTFEQVLELATRAEVPHLVFFHHSPERTDTELLGILDRIRGAARAAGHTLTIDAAEEGRDLVLRPDRAIGTGIR